jgi:hypothetical protein
LSERKSRTNGDPLAKDNALMLSLHLIDPNDYLALEDDQLIGRIRLARERSPSIWLWNVTVTHSRPTVRRREDNRRCQGALQVGVARV